MKSDSDFASVPAPSPRGRLQSGAVVLAALALPGVYAPAVHAEAAPEQGVIAFKYLYYEDYQPGTRRVTVNSPSVYVATPLGRNWSAEGSMVLDSLSGATPRWQSNLSSVSGASEMSDERTAGDVKVTRHFDRSSYSVGLSHSNENDYVSNAFSLQGAWSTDDNNRTWTLGYGRASDKIDPTKGGSTGTIANEKKNTDEFIFGVTQAVSANDIAQLNLTIGNGKGYYSDPYKTLDRRPRERSQFALLGRWNHFLNGNGSTLRGSYRYYNDSFGIKAHTLQAEWVKPVTDSLTLTPMIRYYTQSSAKFYVDGQYRDGFNILPNLSPGQFNSGDQRLSAFGALSLGIKAQYKVNPLWAVDGKLETYEQRSSWRLGGQGSAGVDTFKANIVQMGVSRKF